MTQSGRQGGMTFCRLARTGRKAKGQNNKNTTRDSETQKAAVLGFQRLWYQFIQEFSLFYSVASSIWKVKKIYFKLPLHVTGDPNRCIMIDWMGRSCIGAGKGRHWVTVYIKPLTYTPESSVLERWNWPRFERLVGLGDGVCHLRRETAISPSTWQRSSAFNREAVHCQLSGLWHRSASQCKWLSALKTLMLSKTPESNLMHNTHTHTQKDTGAMISFSNIAHQSLGLEFEKCIRQDTF